MKKTLISFFIFFTAFSYGQTASEYFTNGIKKTDLKDYKGAIVDFTKSIEIKPYWGDTYLCRGKAKAYLEDYRGAIADFTKNIEFYPNNGDAYLSRGESKVSLNDFHGAIADFNNAIEIFPTIYVYVKRGQAKDSLKDYQGAIVDFTKAIEINLNYSEGYLNRGLTKLKLNQKDSGCLDLGKAGELGNNRAYELIKKYCN
ncbi:tetratricopeptide repeat protein [Flavobacterium sp.]|jgi:tetratricopeptide (TPR) repeat protein|uniref:tetratricopeptide repeat protein n=1 Tax=Flavobacterium sp. TaxID=239 RepID=UPI0037BF1B8A